MEIRSVAEIEKLLRDCPEARTILSFGPNNILHAVQQ
jgi:hypothetical protein